jgi:hypothetical protein
MANITMIARNVSLALAQKHDFKPCTVPDQQIDNLLNVLLCLDCSHLCHRWKYTRSKNLQPLQKSLRMLANMLVMNLAVSDLLLMISLIPEAVYNFSCGGPWQFGDLGCQINTFCGQL